MHARSATSLGASASTTLAALVIGCAPAPAHDDSTSVAIATGPVEVTDLGLLDGSWYYTGRMSPDSCQSSNPCWWTREYTLTFDASSGSYSYTCIHYDDGKAISGAWLYRAAMAYEFPGFLTMTEVTYQLGSWPSGSRDPAQVTWGETSYGSNDYSIAPVRLDGDTLQWNERLYSRLVD